jgi:hypothetical protein
VVRVAQWPMNVIPDGEDQIDQAIGALATQAEWREPITPQVRQELIDWFEHGWSAQALLIALDRRPDNVIQRRRGTREELHDYIQRRMRFWFDDSPDADSVSARLQPPRQGQSLEHWLAVRQRNNHTSAPRVFRPLSERGQQARQRALASARGKLTKADRVARARTSDAKRQAAMDSLGMSSTRSGDQTLAQLIGQAATGATGDQLTANYAGRRALILGHPRVRAIIDRAAAERRPPTSLELSVLRNAVHEAKVAGAAAQLEAWLPESGEILSPAGLRMLAYLDNAVSDDLPFDSLVTLITVAVDGGDY